MSHKIEIDLAGPQGNVYYLLAVAANHCRRTNVRSAPILADMQSADYTHALEVFEQHFGHAYTLTNKGK